MYAEIHKLKSILENNNIPFEFDNFLPEEGFSIHYPDIQNCICYAIETEYSQGYDEDLIQITGLLTKEEAEIEFCRGFLTAEEVFNRIKKHWEERKKS